MRLRRAGLGLAEMSDKFGVVCLEIFWEFFEGGRG
jgi:hypothetical protein